MAPLCSRLSLHSAHPSPPLRALLAAVAVAVAVAACCPGGLGATATPVLQGNNEVVLAAAGAGPTARFGPSLTTLADNQLFLVGGLANTLAGSFRDAWTLTFADQSSIGSNVWGRVPDPPAAYSSRAFHSASSLLINRTLLGPTGAASFDSFGVFVFGGQNVVILGRDVVETPLGDLWVFLRPGTWLPVVPPPAPPGGPATSPSPRFKQGAVALTGACMLLFGGSNGTAVFGDTWLFNSLAQAWVELVFPPGAAVPDARYGHFLVSDTSFSAIMGFGCVDPLLCGFEQGPRLQDLWTFQLSDPDSCTTGNWTQGSVTSSPNAYSAVASIDDKVYAFGGIPGTGSEGELLEFLAEFAELRAPAIQFIGVPSPRWLAAATRTAKNNMVVFGGQNGWTVYDDLWLFAPSLNLWSRIPTVTAVRPRARILATLTSIGDEAFLIGGVEGGENHVFEKAWSVTTEGAWTHLPQWRVQRFSHTTVRWGAGLLVYGGVATLFATRPINRPCILLKGADKLCFHAPAAVTPRAAHGAVSWSDPDGTDHMVIFGGVEKLNPAAPLTPAQPFLDDAWIVSMNVAGLDLAIVNISAITTWRRIVPRTSTTPGHRVGHSTVLLTAPDGTRLMAVYGGYVDVFPRLSEDLFLLDVRASTWTQVPRTPGAVWPGKLSFSVGFALSPTSFGVSTGIAHLYPRVIANETWVATLTPARGVEWSLVNIDDGFPIFVGSGTTFESDPSLLFIFGGTVTVQQQISDNLVAVRLTCNPGSFVADSTEVLSCTRCPLGMYSHASGAETCLPCPGGTFTEDQGASLREMCTVCRPGICVHGNCEVLEGFRTQCSCSFGYTGPTCETNFFAAALLSILGFVGLIAGAIFLQRFNKRRVVKLREYSFLQQRLLETSQYELAELEKGWEIEAEDVRLVSRIDLDSPGSFGEVWLASWQDRQVAVKRLRESLMQINETLAADFQAEVKFMRTLRHRNIVFFYGAGVMQATPFLVTEYLPVGALKSLLLSSEFLSWSTRLSFANDAAAGMAFLHGLSPPRIHRDLKTANLLVSDAFVVKVADFGTSRLSRHVKDSQRRRSSVYLRPRHDSQLSRHAETEEAYGTLIFAAPETLEDGAFHRPYALASDVYSYGHVLWELAERREQYAECETLWDVRDKILAGEAPPLVKPCPEGYREILSGCWQMNADSRPSFVEVRNRLIAIQDATP